MRRELKDMGESILKKQCADLGLEWASLTAADIPGLAPPLSRAITAFTGKEKADRIAREVERLGALEELASVGEVGEAVGRRRRMDVLSRLGEICHLIGEWENALDYYKEAEGLAFCLKERHRAFGIGCSIGLALLEMGRCDEAEAKLVEVLGEAGSAIDAEAAASASRALGKVMWRTGRFGPAVEYCMMAMEHYASAGDRRMRACLYKDLGDAYGERGEHAQGLEHYSNALSLFDPRLDVYSIANVRMNMGVIRSMMKDWEGAARDYEECIAMTEREGYVNTMAWALFNLGEAKTKMGMLDEAETALSRAAELLEKTDDRMGMAGVSMKRGELCQARGKWRDAVPHFEACIATLREMGIPRYLADALHELGLTLERLGRRREAGERFAEAVSLYEKLGVERSAANARADLERVGGKGQ
jgi:tetratricopeptide (TPR) repeat protein